MSNPTPGPSASWKPGTQTDTRESFNGGPGEDRGNYLASVTGAPICIHEEDQSAYRDEDVGETGSEYQHMCDAMHSCHGHLAGEHD